MFTSPEADDLSELSPDMGVDSLSSHLGSKDEEVSEADDGRRFTIACAGEGCYGVFQDEEQYRNHLKIHKMNHFCVAKDCNAAFFTVPLLNRHIKTCHGEQPFSKSSVDDNDVNKNSFKIYKCRFEDCRFTFKYSGNRDCHELVHKKPKTSHLDNFYESHKRDVTAKSSNYCLPELLDEETDDEKNQEVIYPLWNPCSIKKSKKVSTNTSPQANTRYIELISADVFVPEVSGLIGPRMMSPLPTVSNDDILHEYSLDSDLVRTLIR